MNEFLPREFVKREQGRVIEPDPTFARRVVSGLRPVARPAGLLWDYIPSFARPMVAATTALLLALISFQMIFSAPFPEGDVGIVDAYLGEDSGPEDEWLYRYA
jgi:hypothetical protein